MTACCANRLNVNKGISVQSESMSTMNIYTNMKS